MTAAKKDVIYIDSDDDITAVIEKVSVSDAGIIALVLPKRYATLKSSVNMKLVKKTADDKKCKLVLITDDSALLPLAGMAGIHVASSLKARPHLPKAPSVAAATAATAVIDDGSADEESADDTKADTPDDKDASDDDKAPAKSSDKSEHIKKIKGGKRIRVPDFGRFRNRFILAGVILVFLIAGWFWAFRVAPEGVAVIQAQTSRIPTEFDATLNPNAEANDVAQNTVRGEVQQISKTVTERFTATGEKDVGTPASGIMTVQNCDSSDDILVPSGTIFTDNTNGFTFSSSAAITVPGGSFSGGGCSSPGEADVTVVATQGGDNRNLSPRAYSVGGFSGLVTGFGGAMSGGTSQIVKVVSAEDISNAKQALLNAGDENIKTELASLFTASTIILDETFSVSNTDPVESVPAGTEATEGTVSAEFTYSVIGIPQDVMDELLDQAQAAQVDTESLSILDNGIDTVVVRVSDPQPDGTYLLTITTNGFAGPEIDIDELKEEIQGKRFSEAVTIIEEKPGVKSVELSLTPFWVFSVPGPDKTEITIQIDEATP